jgi:hypothetical protein
MADVVGQCGRESGYRLTQALREQLEVRCPIFLLSAAPTSRSRAHALQCGATRVLADDHNLIDDLMLLVRGDGSSIYHR